MTSELDNRNIAVSMRKSVENLVISSQDAIGQSISQALTFSGVLAQHANQIMNQENRTVSRSPSPSLRSTDASNADVIDSDKNDTTTIQVPTHAGGDAISLASLSDSLPSRVPLPLPSPSPSAAAGARGADVSRSKKKSWYSALYPTYKSRSEDFKRLFKDLPDDERLIVDYSCALQKEILAHGRLYASQHYLCFYANIFGWESSLSLRWKDITAITKEKTALVIPNAILVCTDTEKNFLTSFSGRDKAYLMLFRVWQNALMDQPLSSQEIWQWVHSCYGEQLGFNSDDEGYSREAEDSLPPVLAVLPALHALAADGADLADSADIADTASELLMESSGVEGGCGEDSMDTSLRPMYSRSVSQPPESLHTGLEVGEARRQQHQTGDSLPTDMSDTSDSEHEKHSGGHIERCTINHDAREVLKVEVPINIDQMFTMIFTNSKFNLELLAARGASDYIQASWQHDEQTGLERRQISYTIGLSSGPIGPKEVYVTETQVMNKCSKPGVAYSIDALSENAGIPYAEYFSVLVHYCLSRRADCATLLTMHSRVTYRKSVWPMVRSFLEKNALGGVEEFSRLLESRLLIEAEHAPKRKPRRRRRPAAACASEGSVASALPLATSRPPAPRASAPHHAAPPGVGTPATTGARWWAGVLVLLLLINALLYWRLYCATARPTLDAAHHRLSELTADQMSEWSRLLEQHSQQLQAWRDALDTAVHTLTQTEQALSNLLTSIQPSLEKASKEASAVHPEL